MISGLFSLDENWGAKVERKILKSNSANLPACGRQAAFSCYLISVTVPNVL
jgi:hypothetical protein